MAGAVSDPHPDPASKATSTTTGAATKSRRGREMEPKQTKRPPYLLLNLSQDGHLTLSHWNDQDGTSPCKIGDKDSSKVRNTYKQTLPTSHLGKTMAKIHYNLKHPRHGEKQGTRDNCSMNLMFHQWQRIQWNPIVSSEDDGRGNSYDDDTISNNAESAENAETAILNNYDSDSDDSSSDSAASLEPLSFEESSSSFISSNGDSLYESSFNDASLHGSSLGSSHNFSVVTTQDSCPPPVDRTVALAAEYGPNVFSKMTDEMMTMKHKTIVFQDFGMPFTFPIACILAYAIQGHSGVVKEILRSLDNYRSGYEKKAMKILRAQDKERYQGQFEHCNSGSNSCVTKMQDSMVGTMATTFQKGIGWCGWYLYMSFYRMRGFSNALPLSNPRGLRLCQEDEEIVLDSIGMVGLRLMRWGLIGNATTETATKHVTTTTAASDHTDHGSSSIMDDLYSNVIEIIQDEIDMLHSIYGLCNLFNDDIRKGRSIQASICLNALREQKIDVSNHKEEEDETSRVLASIAFEQQKRRDEEKERMVQRLLSQEIVVTSKTMAGSASTVSTMSSTTPRFENSYNHGTAPPAQGERVSASTGSITCNENSSLSSVSGQASSGSINRSSAAGIGRPRRLRRKTTRQPSPKTSSSLSSSSNPCLSHHSSTSSIRFSSGSRSVSPKPSSTSNTQAVSPKPLSRSSNRSLSPKPSSYSSCGRNLSPKPSSSSALSPKPSSSSALSPKPSSFSSCGRNLSPKPSSSSASNCRNSTSKPSSTSNLHGTMPKASRKSAGGVASSQPSLSSSFTCLSPRTSARRLARQSSRKNVERSPLPSKSKQSKNNQQQALSPMSGNKSLSFLPTLNLNFGN